MRVVGYLRVSTDRQAEEGLGPRSKSTLSVSGAMPTVTRWSVSTAMKASPVPTGSRTVLVCPMPSTLSRRVEGPSDRSEPRSSWNASSPQARTWRRSANNHTPSKSLRNSRSLTISISTPSSSRDAAVRILLLIRPSLNLL